MTTAGGESSGPVWARSWPLSAVVSIAVVVLLWAGLGLVPSWLTAFLDERGLDPRLRDGLVTLVFSAAFGGIAFALSRLQSRGRI